MNTQTPDNEVARLKEQNQNIRDAYLKSVERDDFITQENARLRELLNRAIDYTKNALFFARTYDNKIQWNEIDKLWEKIRDLEKETLTPTTEEPVTQEESSDAVRYADYILNHYDRNSEKDKLCLAKNLLRHGWNNGQPTALAPEEQTLCLREPTAEESKVLDKVLEELREEDRHYAPEWRELLNRAIDIAREYQKHARKNINEDCDWSMQGTHQKFNELCDELARLATEPEEPKNRCWCNNPSIISATHNGKTYEQCSKCGEEVQNHDGRVVRRLLKDRKHRTRG